MAWHRGDPGRQPAAVALLGTSLTDERLRLLLAARLDRVVVALDAEPAAQVRAARHVERLRDWGLDAVAGTWRGGKDAGIGAALEPADWDEEAQVRRLLTAR
jgi:MoaA/NifB/PqqE/SkfB family radical SAM enzyme